MINRLENKSTGHQSIPIKPLKLIPDLILVPFVIINQLFLSGKYPEALKVCKVIPTTDDLITTAPVLCCLYLITSWKN